MGPCHWIQMFSAPRPEYTCPIELTLTLPPTEQTSLLQTLCCSNLFGVRARGTTVCPHMGNQKWCYQTPGEDRAQSPPSIKSSRAPVFFGPPLSSPSRWVLSVSAGCLTKNTCFFLQRFLGVKAEKPQWSGDERTVEKGWRGRLWDTNRCFLHGTLGKPKRW